MRKSVEAARSTFGYVFDTTICMVFSMLVGVGCHTIGGETVDPLSWIVTGLVGSLLAGPSVKRP